MLKNITLSAEEWLIEKGRNRAATDGRSLNDAFREWLETWTARQAQADVYDRLMDSLLKVDTGRKFSRDEMNAR